MCELKLCSNCKLEKEVIEFSWRSDNYTWRNECKKCCAIYAVEYRKNNKEKCTTSKNKYIQNNKEKYLLSRRNNYNNKKKNNPQFKLRNHCSRTIRRMLLDNKSNKGNSSILDYIPYTMQELREHLELLWEPWMNWDNYGPARKMQKTWQIDHIIPQYKLPYDSMEHSNFLKCWTLSNLRPLESMANIKKGCK